MPFYVEIARKLLLGPPKERPQHFLWLPLLPDMQQSHRAREAVPKGCPTEIKNNVISLMVGSDCCAQITAEARGDREAQCGASARSAREGTPTVD